MKGITAGAAYVGSNTVTLSDTLIKRWRAAKGRERKFSLKGNQPMKNDHQLQGLLLAVYSTILYLPFSLPTSCLGARDCVLLFTTSYEVLNV